MFKLTKSLLLTINNLFTKGETIFVNDTDILNYWDSDKQAFKSLNIPNLYWKFYSSYDALVNDTDTTDNNVFKVLIVNEAQLYFRGSFTYQGQIYPLRDIILPDSTTNFEQVNFFLIPMIEVINKQYLSYGRLLLYIDYNTQFDNYGYYSADLSELVNYPFFAKDFKWKRINNCYLIPEFINNYIENPTGVIHRISSAYKLRCEYILRK